jgi:hypothetical protein
LRESSFHKELQDQIAGVRKQMAGLHKKQDYFQSDLLTKIEKLTEKEDAQPKDAIVIAEKVSVSIKRKLQTRDVVHFLRNDMTFCDLGHGDSDRFPGLVLSFIYYHKREVTDDVKSNDNATPTPVWNTHMMDKIKNWKIYEMADRILNRMNYTRHSSSWMKLTEVQEFLQQWSLELYQRFGTIHPLFITKILAYDEDDDRYILITPTCVADFSSRICTGRKIPHRMILANILSKNRVEPALAVVQKKHKSKSSVFVSNRTYQSLVGYKVYCAFHQNGKFRETPKHFPYSPEKSNML